jgi:hypothetical protein
MAIHLEATYAKKLGLPNFSSHQYAVTLRVELADISQVEAESAKLYRLLQDAVDREIVEVGYMPDATVYGMDNRPSQNGNGNGHRQNGNGHHANGSNGEVWNCTDGQKGFITKLVNENKLNKDEVERLSMDLFGVGVKKCDRLQASQLIEELLEMTGQGNRRQRFTRRQPAARQ